MARDLFAQTQQPAAGRDLFASQPPPAPQGESRSIADVLGANQNIAKMQEMADKTRASNPSAARELEDNIKKEIGRTMELEEVRLKNPYLAEMIESTPQWQKSAIGIGRGMTDIGRAVGAAGPEQSTEALNALEGQSKAGEGARMLGQAAPFAPLGVGAAAIKTALPRTAAFSTLGGSEGFLSQTGMGEDPTIATTIGAAVPALATVAPKVVRAAYKPFEEYAQKRKSVKTILGAATPNDIVDEAASIVKTGGPEAQSKLDQLMLTDESVNSIHPTVRKINEAIKEGAAPEDVAKIIEDQRDIASKGEAAKYRLEGEKLKKSKTAQEMIRQGMPKNDVQLIASSSAGDKEAFKKIIDRVKGGLSSSRIKNKLHPQAVVGDSVLERLNYVKKINTEAGEKIKQVAKDELQGKAVSLDEPLANFKAELDSLGVKFDNGQISFEGSALMDLPKLQAPIKRILNRINPARNPSVDAYDAHILKKWFDSNINYGKTPTGGGMEPAVENAIKSFRHDINEALGVLSPKYKAVNTQYADTIGAINDLKNLAGKKRDLAGEFADETLGMLSKRVTSNAMSRGQVGSAIEALEDVSAKYGKVFKDDIATQVQFVNAIEKQLGAFSDTSLMGQVQAPMMRAAGRGAKGDTTMLGVAIDVADALKKKMKPVDEAAYIKALEDLINGK